MKLRFPLFAKILLWFFLNMILMVGALFLLLRAQVHSGFDWLLSMGAGPRIQAVCNVLVSELDGQPRSEWSDVLKRFDDAYHLRFFLFRDGDGLQMAGDFVQLPDEVQERICVTLGTTSDPMLQGIDPEGSPAESTAEELGSVPLPQSPDYVKFVVHTLDPTRYWVLVRVEVQDPGMSHPIPTTIVVMSSNMGAGGLLFDFKPWLIVGFGSLVFSVLFWFPLIRSLTRSIGEMTVATHQVAEGRFDTRVDESRHDELGLLGKSINRMAARLAGFVTGQRRFLGDIAHELCAPIARTQMALGILEQRANEKNKAQIEDLCEEVQNMSNLVNELLSFSKASFGGATIKLRPVFVLSIIKKAMRLEGREEPCIKLDIPPHLSVMAEPELLVRAMANLVRNAVRYAGRSGPITVSARRENDNVLVTVSDCGPGLPEQDITHIFDPFYRPDTSRDTTTGGVGLGLAIVKTCVESCSGSVSCKNRQPSGLEVTIKLMKATEQPGSDEPDSGHDASGVTAGQTACVAE
jgi:two-component system sensor histidine kinase CpxA